jgi:pimeloyl-ACP methyl ester carboxylesterase
MRLHTDIAGHGARAVAFIHGVGGSGIVFAELINLMVATGEYTCITLDLRGHGLSPRSSDYSIAAFADDVIETLPSGLHTVIGHSFGGRILLHAVAELRPERALYLDPDFEKEVPGEVIGTPTFWGRPMLAGGVGRMAKAARPEWGAANMRRATLSVERWDRSMAREVMAEASRWPAEIERPTVPSSLVLSEVGFQALSLSLLSRLELLGWDVRLVPGIPHPMHMEDPESLFGFLRDLL